MARVKRAAPSSSIWDMFRQKSKENEMKRKEFDAFMMGGRGAGKSRNSSEIGAMFYAQDGNIVASGGGGGTAMFSSDKYRPKKKEPSLPQLPHIQLPYSDNTNNNYEYFRVPNQRIPRQSSPYQWYDGTARQEIPEGFKKLVEEKIKQKEYDPEIMKGKICAVVTITYTSAGESVTHTGVLFVKKCGYWKLVDFDGKKVVGGSEGSFEGDVQKGRLYIQVHKTLYDADSIQHNSNEMDLEIT